MPFNVDNVLTMRGLLPSDFGIAGAEFARVVFVMMHPTFYNSKLQMYAAYRRSDGADIVQRISVALSSLCQTSVTDLADSRTGSVAGALTAALDECDVLILYDTPAAAQSDWIMWEVSLALSQGVPIVWVRIGSRSHRGNLPVRPANDPDLEIVEVPSTEDSIQVLARRILDKAIYAAAADVRRVAVTLRRLHGLAQVVVLDERQQIYSVMLSRRLGRNTLRPETYVVQLFGRHLLPSDGDRFVEWLRAKDYRPDDPDRRGFDLAVMLSPRSGESLGAVEGVIAMRADAFLAALSRRSASQEVPLRSRPELVLLVGFPSLSGASREVRDAVREVVLYWLGRGGRVRFLAHPALTPLVAMLATEVVPGEERERVTVYTSSYFRTTPAQHEIAEIATVVETRAVGDRRASLTLLRQLMINDRDAVAAVVIGGRASARDPSSGIEEEVHLARSRGLPVFVLGATGGQASRLAHDARKQEPPWGNLGNELSFAENDLLATTDNYWSAAELIWTNVALREPPLV